MQPTETKQFFVVSVQIIPTTLYFTAITSSTGDIKRESRLIIFSGVHTKAVFTYEYSTILVLVRDIRIRSFLSKVKHGHSTVRQGFRV